MPQSPAAHAADRHDLIRVQGARVNNLKDISIELPKRRLTVFTGVSGSGKSSLVFGTIAAESQRLGAHPRSTVGTVTDANAMLRILFRAWARSTTSTCRRLYDDSLSLNAGALTIPGYSMEGWYGRCTTSSTKSRRRSRSTGPT